MCPVKASGQRPNKPTVVLPFFTLFARIAKFVISLMCRLEGRLYIAILVHQYAISRVLLLRTQYFTVHVFRYLFLVEHYASQLILFFINLTKIKIFLKLDLR